VRDIDVIALALDDWLRLQGRDGLDPPISADVRRVLTRVALAAPETAARCPRLLRFVGTGVAAQVKALAGAAGGSGIGSPGVGRSRWLSTAEAATALDLKPNSVRWLLRQGHLTGQRGETGWQVSAASVEAYRHGATRDEFVTDRRQAAGAGPAGRP
jgi:hypothetical protein